MCRDGRRSWICIFGLKQFWRPIQKLKRLGTPSDWFPFISIHFGSCLTLHQCPDPFHFSFTVHKVTCVQSKVFCCWNSFRIAAVLFFRLVFFNFCRVCACRLLRLSNPQHRYMYSDSLIKEKDIKLFNYAVPSLSTSLRLSIFLLSFYSYP